MNTTSNGNDKHSNEEPTDPSLYLLNPIRCFIINPHPERGLAGLEVGFDDKGAVGIRTVADNEKGFCLTREAALQLAELITVELAKDDYSLAT